MVKIFIIPLISVEINMIKKKGEIKKKKVPPILNKN